MTMAADFTMNVQFLVKKFQKLSTIQTFLLRNYNFIFLKIKKDRYIKAPQAFLNF